MSRLTPDQKLQSDLDTTALILGNQFVLNATNCHYDLVEALSAAREMLSCFVGPDDEVGMPIIQMADAALAKAKGE